MVECSYIVGFPDSGTYESYEHVNLLLCAFLILGQRHENHILVKAVYIAFGRQDMGPQHCSCNYSKPFEANLTVEKQRVL